METFSKTILQINQGKTFKLLEAYWEVNSQAIFPKPLHLEASLNLVKVLMPITSS